MSDRRRTRYRAERMGFVFQFFNLLPVLSAAENVELPLLVAGVKPHDARARAREALAMVGLAGEEDKRPAEVSGGQQQRVSIARALVNQPAIVWGDEPTGSLDSENAAAVMELLRSLNREHAQTFVLVTHDPNVAAATDRIIRMRDGRIEADSGSVDAGSGEERAGAAVDG
jgi:ABC-type lipoprotein export system ATPase subunit